MVPNLITFSYPTTGASGYEEPAATYSFFSVGYKPPTHLRSVNSDIVHNHNGVFKYVYDNGPACVAWEPFALSLDEQFASVIGTASQQWANLLALWNHTGQLRMSAPDGAYDVHWAGPLDKQFINFPDSVGDKIEYRVVIQIEEA